jgi:hypothetical protein
VVIPKSKVFGQSGAKSNEGMAAVIENDSTPKRRAVRTLRSKL